jgi:hypothetical protein
VIRRGAASCDPSVNHSAVLRKLLTIGSFPCACWGGERARRPLSVGLRGGMGLESSWPMSHGWVGKGASLFGAWAVLGAGCFQPVCEAPGGCPHPESALDAGVDAGSDGGLDAGGDVTCTQNSDCPSGTDCDFRCGEPTANAPYYRYALGAGVCRINRSGCAEWPNVCNDPGVGYCDFEGRCVSMEGLCQKPFGCPSDCTQAGPCGCLCPTCIATATAGQ